MNNVLDAGLTQPQLTGAVAVVGVEKTFGHGADVVHAVGPVSLEIPEGQFVCLVGRSGCGKSTLLRMVSGLEIPSQGSITVDDRPVNKPGVDRAMIFQAQALFPWRTVAENVMFGPQMTGVSKAERQQIAGELLHLVGLEQFAKAYPHQLSGGMQQLCAIARALATKPRILLADEPFGALDAQTREDMQQRLLDVWSTTGISIIFVTHSVQEAVQLADRIIVMTPRPARIADDLLVDLERPRDVTSAAFGDVARRVYAKLKRDDAFTGNTARASYE